MPLIMLRPGPKRALRRARPRARSLPSLYDLLTCSPRHLLTCSPGLLLTCSLLTSSPGHLITCPHANLPTPSPGPLVTWSLVTWSPGHQSPGHLVTWPSVTWSGRWLITNFSSSAGIHPAGMATLPCTAGTSGTQRKRKMHPKKHCHILYTTLLSEICLFFLKIVDPCFPRMLMRCQLVTDKTANISKVARRMTLISLISKS